MTDKKKNTWDELKPQDRLFILICMKESIHVGIKKLLINKTYQHFKYCLNNDKEFNPSDVWDILPDQSRDHFNHSFDYMQTISDSINREMKVLAPPIPKPLVAANRKISRRGKGKTK
jgi:hypothetical protein